eukprot:CAMPEP_0177681970 /NCGR_PEP_ID=MMETSP0447-20121125/31008_1 /TAXON_ID=0 /ORGANISM="Stygamoeba regulata, Strain BSH-02190019" /LENGTH=832 /DNA_ID=CAMNT_0019191439 /DNA_START=63 /DNA_END=2561 /DNA_ORIENTATION=-
MEAPPPKEVYVFGSSQSSRSPRSPRSARDKATSMSNSGESNEEPGQASSSSSSSTSTSASSSGGAGGDQKAADSKVSKSAKSTKATKPSSKPSKSSKSSSKSSAKSKAIKEREPDQKPEEHENGTEDTERKQEKKRAATAPASSLSPVSPPSSGEAAVPLELQVDDVVPGDGDPVQGGVSLAAVASFVQQESEEQDELVSLPAHIGAFVEKRCMRAEKLRGCFDGLQYSSGENRAAGSASSTSSSSVLERPILSGEREYGTLVVSNFRLWLFRRDDQTVGSTVDSPFSDAAASTIENPDRKKHKKKHKKDKKVPAEESEPHPLVQPVLELELLRIHDLRVRIARNVKSDDDSGSPMEEVRIRTKDGAVFFVYASSKDTTWRAVIQAYALPETQEHLFAYLCSPTPSSDAPLYDPRKEYGRIGLLDDERWRLSEANQDYSLCSTYPQLLVVPAAASDEELRQVAQHRSRGRLAVCVWKHPETLATLNRCSQPCVGLKRRRSKADEAYLGSLCNEGQTKLKIKDSRPKVNAVANRVNGGGYEHTGLRGFYRHCSQLQFNDIGNIHVMRQSLKKYTSLCSTKNPSRQELDETQWLKHCNQVILSVRGVIEDLTQGKSVLVHCSDGWDRTSQTVSLTELLLDPYYRTLRGFIVLIEKDWLSFGHKFATRHGHGTNINNPKDSQRSPIFIQFLDIVWQFMQQFPTSFEFNERFLVTLMDNVYSCRFGTFLCDNDQQRTQASLATSTESFWNFVLAHQDLFINSDMYMSDSPQFLNPKALALQLMVWKNYYQTRLGGSPAVALTAETESSPAPAAAGSSNANKQSKKHKKESKKHKKK